MCVVSYNYSGFIFGESLMLGRLGPFRGSLAAASPLSPTKNKE